MNGAAQADEARTSKQRRPAAEMKIIESCIRGAIGGYQRFVSPLLGPHCRYYPSCSQYMSDAVSARGPLVGFALGLFRLARCNPLFPGGFDPVAPERHKEARSGGTAPSTGSGNEKE